MSSHKKKSKNIYKDDFTVEDDAELSICNLVEGEPIIEGNILKSFSFENSEDNTTYNSYDDKTIFDQRTSKANPNGRTPPIDGETFDMVRTYVLRRSTVRILSKIKAIHVDDNVYLNTIVDEAIRHYYDYLKKNLKD
jgi:hypothetical protein